MYRLQGVTGTVAKRIALIRNDRSDVCITQNVAELRHHGTVDTIHDRLDVRVDIAGNHIATRDSWKHARDALTFSLMTAHAIVLIDLCACRHEFLMSPLSITFFVESCKLKFFLNHPGVVILLRFCFDDDGHEAMVAATKLGTLATIDARLFDTRPILVDESRDGIFLDREIFDPP